jgi:hypothetical protein
MTDATPSAPPAAPSDPPLRGLRMWAVIAEIVAAAAVVTSLIFVGVQLAQANKLERNAAMQRQIEAVTLLSRSVIDTPALSDMFVRANGGEQLTRDEQVKLEAFLLYADRTWEGLYLLYLDGQIDKDLWEAHRAQALPVNNALAAKAVWNARRGWFTPRYRAFRDNELATNADKLLNYDHFDALRKPQPPAPVAAEAPAQ